MNKKSWFIPVLIVAVNVLAIIVCWTSLSEVLPAHFDLEGNAGGSMPRNMLLLYPLASGVVCLVSYVIARIWKVLQKGLAILSSGISLVILFSLLVTLTRGTMPIFMLAEPVILLAAVIGFIVSVVKQRKKGVVS